MNVREKCAFLNLFDTDSTCITFEEITMWLEVLLGSTMLMAKLPHPLNVLVFHKVDFIGLRRAQYGRIAGEWDASFVGYVNREHGGVEAVEDTEYQFESLTPIEFKAVKKFFMLVNYGNGRRPKRPGHLIRGKAPRRAAHRVDALEL